MSDPEKPTFLEEYEEKLTEIKPFLNQHTGLEKGESDNEKIQILGKLSDGRLVISIDPYLEVNNYFPLLSKGEGVDGFDGSRFVSLSISPALKVVEFVDLRETTEDGSKIYEGSRLSIQQNPGLEQKEGKHILRGITVEDFWGDGNLSASEVLLNERTLLEEDLGVIYNCLFKEEDAPSSQEL